MHEQHPVEGEYQPPDQQAADQQPPEQSQPPQQRAKKRAGGLGAIAAAVGVAALKFKALLAVLLNLKFVLLGAKLFAVSWTFVLSMILYVAFFGWRFGLVLVLLIAAHELGHYFAYRAYGLPVRVPVFVPFLGAYTAGAIAPSLEDDAYIALAGPVTGLALAGVCYALGVTTGDHFWLAAADLSALLNLFNMIPILPFDGGRIIGAIWAPLWIVGALLFVAAALWLHVPIVFVLLIAILGLPAMIAAFRGHTDPRAATMTNPARARVGLWYLATVIGLLYVIGQSHIGLPNAGTL
jgi:Zn-dependent protease